jgi:hypothetical protein
MTIRPRKGAVGTHGWRLHQPSRISSVALAVFVAMCATSAIAGEPAFCKAHELPVLACLSDKQPMALCASTTAKKMPGLLHFRFAGGPKKNATVFPGNGDVKRAFADYGDYGTSAGPPGNYYAVTAGKTSYVAFSTGPRGEQYGDPFAGFLIERRGQKQVEHLCDDNQTEFDEKGTKLLVPETAVGIGLSRSGPTD